MTVNKSRKILAIETSCDETAAAVLEVEIANPSTRNLKVSVRGSNLSETPPKIINNKNITFPKIKVLSSVVRSQIKLHSKMGGVVPEAAARAHLKYIRPVVEQALTNSNLPLTAIDYIAVTQGPGLLPSLLIGVEFAKALSYGNSIPLVPINHMAGHLYSPFAQLKAISYKLAASVFPMISLIVSGGHTMIVLMSGIAGSGSAGKDIKNYRVLGQTVDDAAGEAFDKVAKMLNLPYPGGPEVSKLAADGNPEAINFPRPMINNKDYNFSFSGLKTSVLYYLRDNPNVNKADLCASFQQAAVEVLVTKTMRAVKEFGAKSVSLSGGVAANKHLRETLANTLKTHGRAFYVPDFKLCTDNAEMIGLAAAFKLHNGFKPVKYNKIEADPNLSL